MNWFRDNAPPPTNPHPHRESLDKLHRLLEIASQDLADIGRLAEDRREGWLFRSFIRATFALIEGTVYAIKQTALAQPTFFDNAELAILREEGAILDKGGDARIRSMHLPLDGNVKFAFMALARSLGGENALNTAGRGWANFQESLAVRHRLMHPKQAEDFEVTYAEFRIAADTFVWFNAVFSICYVTSLQQDAVRSGVAWTDEEAQRLSRLEESSRAVMN